jgi:hypothetical protein
VGERERQWETQWETQWGRERDTVGETQWGRHSERHSGGERATVGDTVGETMRGAPRAVRVGDAKLRIVIFRVRHGATENGTLNDGQIPNPSARL